MHQLYASGGAAVDRVEAAFPGTKAADGSVDRALLSGALPAFDGGRDAALKVLEDIVHPLVLQERLAFLDQAQRDGEWLVILDIPLLFETHADEAALRETCDAVVVVSAPADIQRERVLARPGMTPERFEFILSKQARPPVVDGPCNGRCDRQRERLSKQARPSAATRCHRRDRRD